jgi:hypothetical protein
LLAVPAVKCTSGRDTQSERVLKGTRAPAAHNSCTGCRSHLPLSGAGVHAPAWPPLPPLPLQRRRRPAGKSGGKVVSACTRRKRSAAACRMLLRAPARHHRRHPPPRAACAGRRRLWCGPRGARRRRPADRRASTPGAQPTLRKFQRKRPHGVMELLLATLLRGTAAKCAHTHAPTSAAFTRGFSIRSRTTAPTSLRMM